MKKSFNTTGICNPKRHYMVDTSEKLSKIISLIEQGKYFTINRARQFGKTTTLFALNNKLKNTYNVIKLSFEGYGDYSYSSEAVFVETVTNDIVSKYLEINESYTFENNTSKSFYDFSNWIKNFCKNCNKPVILMIDEVDKSLDNQLFLNFLGMLRNLYLERENRDDYEHFTFFSVILAGVYDVKNLKIKIRPDEERKYNSPWNIATDFDVDMSFSAAEIQTMLDDYEKDYNSGMNTKKISEEIYKYTSGYPFLVSKICELIENRFNRDWSKTGIMNAVKEIEADDECTLINSLTKNIENDSEMKSLLKSLLLTNAKIEFNANIPAIKKCKLFSILKADKDKNAAVHNLIFEHVLYSYFTTEKSIEKTISTLPKSAYINADGKLKMDMVIERFKFFMNSEYRKEDEKFIEQQGRLLFLCFLKPIINGSGFYYVEPQTRENNRMDLVVTYGGEEFIIELKIWRGEKYETEGKVQLAEYLNTRGLDKGYLVTFSFLKDKKVQEEPVWIKHNGKDIFEAVI